MKKVWTVYTLYEKKFESMEEACEFANMQMNMLNDAGYSMRETSNEDLLPFKVDLEGRLDHDCACVNRDLCDEKQNEAAVAVECIDLMA